MAEVRFHRSRVAVLDPVREQGWPCEAVMVFPGLEELRVYCCRDLGHDDDHAAYVGQVEAYCSWPQ